MPEAPSFWRQAAAIAWKDLRIEWKSREIVYTTAFLALLIVLIFAFAFLSGAVPTGGPPQGGGRLEIVFGPGVTAGILWVAVLFSGTVALSRTFDRERESEAIRSLLLSPVSRAAIYVGKLAATAALMAVVELIVAPLCGLFFSTEMAANAGHLALVLLLGTIGFAAVGCVFSAAMLRARSRDTLLAALLYPIVVPVFLAGAKATSQLLDPTLPDQAGAVFWTQFLLVADLIFVVVGLWAFEPVVTNE